MTSFERKGSGITSSLMNAQTFFGVSGERSGGGKNTFSSNSVGFSNQNSNVIKIDARSRSNENSLKRSASRSITQTTFQNTLEYEKRPHLKSVPLSSDMTGVSTPYHVVSNVRQSEKAKMHHFHESTKHKEIGRPTQAGEGKPRPRVNFASERDLPMSCDMEQKLNCDAKKKSCFFLNRLHLYCIVFMLFALLLICFSFVIYFMIQTNKQTFVTYSVATATNNYSSELNIFTTSEATKKVGGVYGCVKTENVEAAAKILSMMNTSADPCEGISQIEDNRKFRL